MNKLIIGAILMGSIVLGGEAFPRQLTPMQVPSSRVNQTSVAHSATRATSAEIIYEAPEGVHKSFYRNGKTYYLDLFGMQLPLTEDQYVIGDVVEGNDGFIYFRNPVMGVQTNSYMKGVKEGDEIVFPLPQPVMDWDGVIIGVDIMEYSGSNPFGGQNAVRVKDIDEIRFKINPDGSYTQLTDENQLLGYYYTDDDSWTTYGTPAQTYYPFDAAPTPFPEDADIKVGQLVYKTNGEKINYAIDGDRVYLADIYPVENGGCAVGVIEGDKVIFDSYQYIGASEESCHYVFFVGANIGDLEADAASTGNKTIEFQFDRESSKLTYCNEGDIVLANASAKEIYYLKYFENPVVGPFVLAPATPVKPVISEYQEFWNYGFAYMNFVLPLLSTEGNLLDTDYYYYNIYIDDEIMEFYPDEYIGLSDVITDMPYNYVDDYSVVMIDGMHQLVFYSEVYDSIGIQGVYIVDGETHRSEIAYANTMGVDTLSEEKLPVTNVEYFDLSGNRITSPVSGIAIRKITFSDGSSKAEKVVKRFQ